MYLLYAAFINGAIRLVQYFIKILDTGLDERIYPSLKKPLNPFEYECLQKAL